MCHVLNGLNCAARSSHILSEFRLAGRNHLMVVADFDYTLTVRYGENGEKGCLTHEVFNDGRKLDDGSSTVGELQRQMNEDYRATYSLWNTSHNIIIRSMLHANEIRNLVRCSRLIWRREVRQFLELLERSSIPLVIFSAGVTNIINEAIGQLIGHIPTNIAVAANVMYFSKDGYVSGFTNPPLHSLCKNVSRLRELIDDLDEKYADRTNILVVGDSDSDASMVDEWEEKRLLKVGLQAQERPPLKSFDIVVKGSDCSRLTDIVKFIISSE
ncbi:hypothetical protein RB195_006765 [Necator americanus]|uniref:5'-nucleotidase n=1 Tax=Necator americanus TaxID=51031 RepID=A0ABR1BU48_NECAM